MYILVFNCGSSTLKYLLINMNGEVVLAKGLVERIGLAGSNLKHYPNGKDSFEAVLPIKDHNNAVKLVIDTLLDSNCGVIKSINEICAVGHRVVHGGEYFSESVTINDKVEKVIEDCSDLAPLHNPANLIGIKTCKAIMPGILQVAVFDTAFHQTMPEKAFLYAIPYELYKKYGIRKYGFHGISHKYVSQKAAEIMGKPYSSLKLVTCHLGNGSSVCAVDGGKSVDTSMGFTPLEGLAMGTRCGDIDPTVLRFLVEKEKMTIYEAESLLNNKSGLLGISGVSSDFRDIKEAAKNENIQSKFALELYIYRVAKYIGEYAAAMNGIDAVVFTAGIGENNADVRESICTYLGYLGVKVDRGKNNCKGKAVDISSEDSRVRVLVIPTNEELVIARDTFREYKAKYECDLK